MAANRRRRQPEGGKLDSLSAKDRGSGELHGRALPRLLKPLRDYVRRRVRYYVETEGLDATQLPAEDFVNESFATALRRRGPGGDRISVIILRDIARTLIGREVERLRQARVREVSLDTPITSPQALAGAYGEEEITLADVIPDLSMPLPAEVYEEGEFWACIDRTFSGLPEPWREVFFLHAVDGFSLDEVARLKGRPVEAIIHSVSQTREHLRDALEAEFGDLLEVA